jgi:glutamate-ammonia-ligase adenylyltransferase
LESLVQQSSIAAEEVARSAPDFLRNVGDLCVVSPPMLDTLRSHPEWLAWLSRRLAGSTTTVHSPETAWNAYLSETGTPSTGIDALRAFKRREYLETSYLDVSGMITLEQVVERLSNLADWVVNRALADCWRRLAEETISPVANSGVPEDFAVLALGKLGGRELNYSSDVDLIFCRRLSDNEAELRLWTRLGERLIQALSQAGPDGFLYRVDMRLRPHGESGPLVPTLESLVTYYESWGESWERQALIKARHVAGSPAIGRRFEEFVTKFTFARQMDDSSLEEIKRVKHRAEREYAQGDQRVHLKQGPGGIRDVEFYIQYLQLTSGWSRPEVRSASTLKAIEALGRARSLLEGEEAQLSVAYRFLRTLEHRLQLRSLTPEALLPKEGRELDLLALGMGIRGRASESAGAQLGKILQGYRTRVRAILERIYLVPGYLRLTEREEEFAQLLSERIPRERMREILEQYRFQDIDKAWQNIRLIALGPAGRLLPPGERRAFLEFVFPLLEVLRDSMDPDLALHRLEIFAAASGNRISFLRSLSSQRAHLQRLVNLLALSSLAHQILSRHPEYFDSLARGIHLHDGRPWQEMHGELRSRLGASPRGESHDAVLRKYRQREVVRIAYRDLAGLAGPLEVSEELTSLGHACVRASWDLTRPASDDPAVRIQDPVSVIAFGKLGSRQMHYSSDLDLVFLYDDPAEDASANHRAKFQRQQDARVERIVELLSGVTSEGVVYDLDLRLRPEGATGLLARSWRSFIEYVLRSMEPWERMALIRSRLLCSESKSEDRWNSIVSDAVYRYSWDEHAWQELRHLKRRIETEKNKESTINIDFKYGKGGIVDLEFLVQWLQLHHGRENSAVRSPTISVAVPQLVRIGAVSASQGEQFLRILRFQRAVENHYQLLEEWNSREISRESPVLQRLALSLGYPGGGGMPARKAFLRDWDECAREIRSQLEAHVFA